MEKHLELKKDQQLSGVSQATVPLQANQRVKQKNRFDPEKPNLSYADLHHEITKELKDNSPKVGHQKQRIVRDTTREDELVKHMSNLPSYLQKGVNRQEKALNVGVLDWGRLEKWQCSNKQRPNRTSRYSFSSSNTSSSFSTDGSSSRDHSCSPSHQRPRRSSLQFHLMATKGNSQPVISRGEGATKFQEVKTSHNSTVSVTGQGTFSRADHPLSRNHPELNLEKRVRKKSETKIDGERQSLVKGMDDGMKSSTAARPRTRTQEGVFSGRVEKSEQLKPFVVDQDVSRKSDSSLPPLPGDFPLKNHPEPSHLYKKVTRLGHRQEEACRRKFSDAPNLGCQADRTDIRHSRLRSCEIGDSTHSQMKASDCIDAEGKRCHSKRSCSVPVLRSEKIEISPPRVRSLEDDHSTVVFKKSSLDGSLKGPNLKASKFTDEKARSTSPFRRLTTGMGKMIKSSSSKEVYEAHQSGSTRVCSKSGRESAGACSCCEVSRKSRSRPLRRLLDPVLKPKVDNGNPVQRDSNKACKPPTGRVDSLSGIITSGKLKLDMASCRIINIDDSTQEKKHGSSAVQQQALLQVAMKNDLPLFTFAVDNNSDVLAATMKKSSTSRKDTHFFVYTFFTIREVKKKNGRWMSTGCKSKGQDIIPNVVAQMKASCSHKHVNQAAAREFVLFSVNLKQTDEQNSIIEANNELAAIVVKVPVKVDQARNEHLIDNGNNLLEAKDCVPVTRVTSQEKGPTLAHDPLNATVILPSGAHTLPNKGGPSSLIERWRSGGSCDCGGWDLGCNLRILGNHSQIHRESISSDAFSNGDRFELFNKVDGDEKQPIFGLSPFKDGIYSVEFNPSLSLLQAFSICIAVVESMKPFGSSNLSEGKNFAETRNNGRRDPERTEGEVPPASYVSCPPHSPIGRV